MSSERVLITQGTVAAYPKALLLLWHHVFAAENCVHFVRKLFSLPLVQFVTKEGKD